MQMNAKKKQLELETALKRETKKGADQVIKLSAKLNKQESLVTKYFGVEQEMTSLRAAALLKDNEISKLKDQLKKSGGAIPEEDEDYDDEDELEKNLPGMAAKDSNTGEKRDSVSGRKRGPPSPD